MPRAVDGTRRSDRRRKYTEITKGFRGRAKSNFRTAKDAAAKALHYATRDRKAKKRDFRRLWVTRISAAVRAEGLTYSRFIQGLNKAQIALNRLALSNLAIEDPQAFGSIVTKVKAALAS
ncbi:MAG: 50S ribosomal protein L20 [Spirochaetales bacterium]|nr:50S ribosomal protein L20 [Spirochaetales bacterium]